MTASSCVRTLSVVVALCVCAIDVSGSSAVEDACIDTGLSGGDLAELIRDALAVLRQSGHDPEGYLLGLRMESPVGLGIADRGGVLFV